MTVTQKRVMRQHLSVMPLIQNAGEHLPGCRRRGGSRTQFYERKHLFQTHRLENLKDLPPSTSPTP